MKKTYLLFFVSLAQITFSFSQTNNYGSVSLSVGPVFPLGKFASTDFSDAFAGFARTGQVAFLSYTKLISENLGIEVAFQGQRNPINTKAFESSFAKAFAQHPDWKVNKGAWWNGALLLGGMGQFALDKSNNISLSTKAMAGVLYAKSPGLTGSSVNGTAAARIEQTKKSAIGFMYSLGGGVRYNLNSKTFFTALLAYNGTNKMIYKNVKTTIVTSQGTPGSPDHAVQQSISTLDGKQTITSTDLLMGVGFRL